MSDCPPGCRVNFNIFYLSLNLTSSFHSSLTVLLLDLRELETSTENSETVLLIIFSL